MKKIVLIYETNKELSMDLDKINLMFDTELLEENFDKSYGEDCVIYELKVFFAPKSNWKDICDSIVTDLNARFMSIY
jgi:hypothetical protein